jgi:integrase/recombinase XerD
MMFSGTPSRASSSACAWRSWCLCRRRHKHQLRHAHAVEMAREGVSLIVIQRQLGHSNLGITSVYLQGIDSGEIIETVHARRAPMIPVSASVRL